MERKNKHIISRLLGAAGSLTLLNAFLEQISSHQYDSWQKKEYFDWNHGRIPYEKLGEGPPILFLHTAYMGGGKHEWCDMYRQLSREHSLYFIDLPGFADGEKRNITYSSYLYATAIINFIQEIITEPTMVIAPGHSAGFAAVAAHLMPHWINRIIMINPPQLQSEINIPDCLMSKILSLPIIGKTFYSLLTSHMGIGYYMASLLKDKQSMDISDMQPFYKAAHTQLKDARWTLQALYDGQLETNLAQHLPLNCPVHVINGQIDFSLPVPNVISTTILENSTYLSHAEEPKSVLREIFRIMKA